MMIAANKQILTDIELSSVGGQILARPALAHILVLIFDI